MARRKRSKPSSDAWRDAWRLVWSRRGRLSFGLLLMMASSGASLVIPYLLKIATDDFIANQELGGIMWIAAALMGATVIAAGTSFWLSQLLGVTAQRAVTDMRRELQRRIARLPISYFDSVRVGELISRVMDDAEGVRNLVGTGLVQMTKGLMTASIALILLFYLNWSMTAIVVVVLMIFGGGMAYTFMKLRPIFRLRWEIHAQISGRLGELFGGIRIVKGYTAEKREELLFAKGAHKLFRNIAKTITATSAVGALTRVLFGAVAVLMMVLGIRAISAGAMTAGDLVAYVALVSMVAMPMVQISNIGTQISEALAGLDRIREIRSMATEDEGDARRERIGEVLGDVAFEDVGFEYKPETPVLRGVSFDAPAGTTTALVGSSGSGKSTLIGLVMAFHRPKSGRVLIDGRDLAGLKLRDYRANLGIVMQDNFLFEGTIAENIAYAAPEAGDEQIAEAARVAHCNEFVDRFADGFQTVVGERGVKLSGGQRQRIAIARAILADPRILILDEATSSLDSESEAMIQDGLATLRRGRTTFVIAHRLSTIRSADRILVMEGGEIVERGTHEELLEADGRYRTLYDKQYQFELNRFINPGEEIAPQTA